MITIVYISSVVRELSNHELTALLEQSREKNARLGVTGILLYRDMDVMQLIEGPAEAVPSLAKTIYADPRHHRIIQLLERNTSNREFPDWSMEFRNVGSSRVHQLSRFMEDEALMKRVDQEHVSPFRTLLLSFGLGR